MKYLHQFVTTNLNVGGGIDDSQTTGIVLQSLNNIDATKPSVACLTWADPLDTSVAEWITYTSVNSTTNELRGVTRGAEGYSAKPHLNQAVIAFPLSKSHVNDLNTAVSAEHNDDGTHKSALVTTLKASAAEVTTGTEDAKIVTPKAIKDASIKANPLATDTLWAAAGDLVKGTGNDAANILSIGTAGDILRVVSGAPAWTGANFKVGGTTRDMTAASGDVSYTSVGFTPKAIVLLAVVDTTTQISIGFSDASAHRCVLMQAANNWSYGSATCIYLLASSASQTAIVKSFDADGFTLTWTKTNSPTGTAQVYYLAFR